MRVKINDNIYALKEWANDMSYISVYCSSVEAAEIYGKMTENVFSRIEIIEDTTDEPIAAFDSRICNGFSFEKNPDVATFQLSVFDEMGQKVNELHNIIGIIIGTIK